MPGGRPREFDRDEALRRAMEVFWERGFQDSSLSTLTAAMGISAPSLYAAFGSKAALFCEAAELYQRQVAGEPQRDLVAAPSARAGFEAYLRGNVRLFTVPGGPRGCLLTKAASTAAADDEVRRYVLRSVRRRIGTLERRAADGRAAGEALPAPPPQLAQLYDTVVQGLAVRADEGASRQVLDRTVALAMELWPRS